MLLDARREELRARLRASLGTTPQSDAFAVRVLGDTVVAALRPDIAANGDRRAASVRYGGYPAVAALGFQVGAADPVPPDWAQTLLTGVTLLRQRPESGVASLAHDDVCGATLDAQQGQLHDRTDRLLLIEHTKWGWDLPGGHLERGETPEEALTREVYDEAGARLDRVTLLGHYLIRAPAR
jgi:8-oxo-dGTP pyrophosphatase MutT (NUDIX family)